MSSFLIEDYEYPLNEEHMFVSGTDFVQPEVLLPTVDPRSLATAPGPLHDDLPKAKRHIATVFDKLFARRGGEMKRPEQQAFHPFETRPIGFKLSENVTHFSNTIQSINDANRILAMPRSQVNVPIDDIKVLEEHTEYYASCLFDAITILLTQMEDNDKEREHKSFSMIQKRNYGQEYIEARCLWAVGEVIKLHRLGSSRLPQTLHSKKIDDIPATVRMKEMCTMFLNHKSLAMDFLDGWKAERLIDQPIRSRIKTVQYIAAHQSKKRRLEEAGTTSSGAVQANPVAEGGDG